MGAIQRFVRSLRGILADRASLTSDTTFDGKRNVQEAFGYKRSLTTTDYRRKARRNGVASRITKAYPTATWRGTDIELIEDPNPEVSTPFEEAWTQLNTTFKLWQRFRRADRLAGFGRYAVMLIRTDEFGAQLEKELTSLSPEALRGFACFDEEDAKIDQWVTDPKDERYGLPLTYKLKRLTEASEAGGAQATRVHASRIIHIPGDDQLDDDLFGEPALEAVWNDLDDLEKVKGAGAEAFWLRVHQGYSLNVDPEMQLTDEAENDLQDEAEAFVHGIQRFIRTRGVEVKALGSDVANYGPNVVATVSLISATKGIPQRILLGSERGELASTQDDANWAARVNDRRHEYAEPWIVRPFVTRMIELGVLPAPAGVGETTIVVEDDARTVATLAEGDKPPVKDVPTTDPTKKAERPLGTPDYTVAWPKLQDVAIEARLDIAKKAADLNKAAGDTIITPAEIRNDFLEMEPLTEEQLAEKQVIEDKKAADKQAELDAIAKSKGIVPGVPPPKGKGPVPPPIPPEVTK